MASDRRVVTYVVLAYATSWAWWIPMAVRGTIVEPGQGWPTHLVGLLGPAIAAFVTTALFDGSAGVRDLLRRVGRWRTGRGPYLIIGATLLVALLPSSASSDVVTADLFTYSGAPEWGPTTLLYVLIINGFGEEIGWRGYLADRLLKEHSLGRTALVVWVVWGVWHLPVFWIAGNFRDLGVLGTIGWIIGIMFGSIFLTWLYGFARSSILIVALWHTAYNLATATEASTGFTAAIASMAVVVAGIVIMRRQPEHRSPRP